MRFRRFTAGFTAAEMLVVAAITAMVMGGAVAAYATITRGQRQLAVTAQIRLPSGAAPNFYSSLASTATDINTFVAPNFGSLARAETIRERFIIDTTKALAVFCLTRPAGTYNTVRPSTIPSPVFGEAPLDTPEAFRNHLISSGVAGASTSFAVAQRPTPMTPCFSIFVLGYSQNATTIPVIAVYDLDIIGCTTAKSPIVSIGNYASLRRYVGGGLMSYYDIFYPTLDATNDSFYPTVVTFERKARKALVEGANTIDRFKVASEKPFYFIFWPDPAQDSLSLPPGNTVGSLNPGLDASDPRRTYNHMGGRTAFWFTVPMFPSL